jgi:hemerythrin-like domain-containing protein
MAAVLHGFEYLVREARETGIPPSFSLLHAMLRWVKSYPEALHHPKEEVHLFPRLRARTHDVDATLDELERQHVEGHALARDLEEAIAAYETDPTRGLPRFAQAVERFASTQIQHMLVEAKVILPAARRHLTREDWAEIGAAISGGDDPRFAVDGDEEFRQLFAHIQNLLPEQTIGAPR